MFAAQEHAAHIDAHQGFPILIRGLGQRAGDAVSGIVDDHIQTAMGGHGGLNHRRNAFGIGDIALHGNRLAAFLDQRGYRLVGRSQITVGNHHFGTLAGKDVASGQTDARSTPCDDTDFIGKTHGYPLML